MSTSPIQFSASQPAFVEPEQQSPLIEKPLIRFEQDIEAMGLVGERKNAKVVFLAAVSAKLPKPLNVSVHGSSSGGKNHLIGTVAKFIPAAAKKMLTGMTPKVLMHAPEDEFQNKALFIAEQEGVSGADYAIRTFQSEQVIEWEFVESSANGIKRRANRVKGPAAFIQATTRPVLHPENETRLLFIEIDESPEQTRAINARQARAAAGENVDAPTGILERWHSFLATLTTTAIVIPFAPKLAESVPDHRVRSRRDFPKLLGLIEVSAFLNQHERSRDSDGRIVATGEDYAVASELFQHSYLAGPDRAVTILLAAAKSLHDEKFALGRKDFSLIDLIRRTGWGKTKGYEVLKRAEELGAIAEVDRGRYEYIHGEPESSLNLPESIE